jgi:hypothetical protein
MQGGGQRTFAEAMLCLRRLSITEMPIWTGDVSALEARRMVGSGGAPLMPGHLAPASWSPRSAPLLVVGARRHFQGPPRLDLLTTWRAGIGAAGVVVVDCKRWEVDLLMSRGSSSRFKAQPVRGSGITREQHEPTRQGSRDQSNDVGNGAQRATRYLNLETFRRGELTIKLDGAPPWTLDRYRTSTPGSFTTASFSIPTNAMHPLYVFVFLESLDSNNTPTRNAPEST